MNSYLKAQSALIMGSMVDFLVSFLLVSWLDCWYLAGNLAGNISGATTQFILSRNWVFPGSHGKIGIKIFKFILVYIGNLLLSALAVYFFTRSIGLHYMLSKLLSSAILGLTYNYFLQKKFVFNRIE